MARGFGGTLGAGTTDAITTAVTTVNSVRSYHINCSRNGDGGGGFGRIFDKTESILFNTGTDYSFIHTFSSGSDGTWTMTRPGSGATWVGVSYDYGSTANNPKMYLDGVSQSVTQTAIPSGTANTSSNPITIGNRASDSARNWDGNMAEFAVWDVILTDDEFKALGTGVSPLLIRPESLLSYIPMVRDNVDRMLSAPTVTGTAVQPHPRVFHYAPKPFAPKASAASGNTLTAVLGTLTLTGLVPAITQGNSVSPPLGTLTLTGLVPTFSQSSGTNMLAALGTLTLTGLVPSITQGNSISPPLGTLTLQGLVPSIVNSGVSGTQTPQGGGRGDYEDWAALAEYKDALRQLRVEAEKPKPKPAVVKQAIRRVEAAVTPVMPPPELVWRGNPDALLRQIAMLEREIARQIEEQDDEEALTALFS